MRNRILLLGLGALIIMAMPVMAFHDGGVADCAGCHTMHNSRDDAAANYDSAGNLGGTPQFEGWDDLLLWENKSDVCLSCHAGTGSYDVFGPDPEVAHTEKGGGDFRYLLADNLNDGHGGGDTANFIPGYQAGHNVISDLMGSVVDPVNAASPGGSYPSDDLSCTSCHDPHGTASFRLLYVEDQVEGPNTFDATIVATSIPVFGAPESNSNHNAYQSGYSDWCAECHESIHNPTGANDIHPSGEVLDTDIVDIYNQYSGSGYCAWPETAPCGIGNYTSAYLAQVPFEDPDITLTSDQSGVDDNNSVVACMSCHRAHASESPDAGRWDFNVTGLAEDGHYSDTPAAKNPYDVYQRSLCNKCHAKDELDELVDFTPAP